MRTLVPVAKSRRLERRRDRSPATGPSPRSLLLLGSPRTGATGRAAGAASAVRAQLVRLPDAAAAEPAPRPGHLQVLDDLALRLPPLPGRLRQAVSRSQYGGHQEFATVPAAVLA